MPIIALIATVLIAVMMAGVPVAQADSAQDAKAAIEAFDRQDFKTAIALLTKVAADKSLPPQAKAAALAYRGGAHNALGEIDAAIKDFQAAIAADPQSLDAETNLGTVLQKQGKYAAAVEHHRRALEIAKAKPPSTESVVAHNTLAWLLATCPDDTVRNGQVAVALATTAATQLASLGPTADATLIARTYDTIGAVYAESNHFPEAIAAAEKSLAGIDAGAPEASEIQQHLASYRAGKPWRLK